MFERLKSNKIQLTLFTLASSYFLFLIHFFQNLTVNGKRFQEWDSDTMMQTLPIQALHDTPIQSLWYLHIDPPFLDTLRALLANIFFRHLNGQPLLDSVDWAMYHVHALIFGAFSVLLFVWARRLINQKFAYIFWLFWILHPAPLVFGTFLDLTFIGTFLMTWFFFEFYRVDRPDGSVLKLAAITIVTFYARSFFQWYIIPALTIALLIRGLDRKCIIKFALITSAFILPYVVKQYLLFGTTSTSTFIGEHKTGVISYRPTNEEIEKERAKLKFKYPEDAEKYSGGDKYNNRKWAEDNLIFSKLAALKYPENWKWTIKQFWQAYKHNRGVYWRPSSLHVVTHKLRDALPWSSIYNKILGRNFLHELVQESLILLLLITFVFRKNLKLLRTHASYFFPVGLIFGSTMMGNIMGWTEVDRLKFFLEPSMYLFVSWIIATLIKNREFLFGFRSSTKDIRKNAVR